MRRVRPTGCRLRDKGESARRTYRRVRTSLGFVGSGRTETMKVVADVLKRDFFHCGEVKLEGKAVRHVVPAPAGRDATVSLQTVI